MSEAADTLSTPTQSSVEAVDLSYEALKELFLHAVSAWSNCEQAVIKNRLHLVWIAHKACVHEHPSTREQFRLNYDGDLVNPSSSELFTEYEVGVLLRFFNCHIGSLLNVGMKDSAGRLISKVVSAEEMSIFCTICRLPSSAGVIEPVWPKYDWYRKRLPRIACDASRVICRSNAIATLPALHDRESITLSCPSIQESDCFVCPMPMIIDDTSLLINSESAPTQEQIEEGLVDDINLESTTPDEVLPFDEFVEGLIIALMNPCLTSALRHDEARCVVLWANGTTESMMSDADVIDAIEVYQSIEGWTIKHPSVGAHVAKRFDGDLFYGQVVRFALEDDGIHLYHVEWSDGDEEDLDWEEFRLASALYLHKINNVVKPMTKNNKRTYIFIEGKLQLKVGMIIARILPLAICKMPLPVESFDILAQFVFISKKALNFKDEAVSSKHPSIGKKVCRVLSLHNHVNKAVHRNHLLQGIITGYIAVSEDLSGELYRVKWDNIEEQQWLTYTEVAKCTPLPKEKKGLLDWMCTSTKTKRRRLNKHPAVVEAKKPNVTELAVMV